MIEIWLFGPLVVFCLWARTRRTCCAEGKSGEVLDFCAFLDDVDSAFA